MIFTVKLLSARRRSQRSAGCDNDRRYYYVSICYFLKQKHIHVFFMYWFPLLAQNTRKMFCRDPVLHWVLRPFQIILWEDIKTLNVTHLRRILIFTHSLLTNLNIRNLKYSLCCAHSYDLCAPSTHAWIPRTFHEIFRRHYFIYTNVKEDFLSLWPLTYLRWLLSCHNPHRARNPA